MKILVTLCARGGSKGIPGKNIKNINGLPLIAYSIKTAQKLYNKFDFKIALSTDCERIKNVASKFNIWTDYKRPKNLASDSAGKVETIKHLLIYEESIIKDNYDYILDLDVTSPLRSINDIEKGFELLKSNNDALNLFSVNESFRNPYFNMVEKKKNGYYSIVKSNDEKNILTRQSAPKVYDLNASFYWYRRSYFNTNNISVITNKSLIYKMNHICFDLDHQVDFMFLEFLLENRKLDFDL